MSKGWLIALRPRAYPATIAPVLLGSALAYSNGAFNPLVLFLALICAMLMQTGSNFINDIYDFRKGADNENRLGAQKVLTSGLLTEKDLKRGAIFVLTTAFLLGLILVWIGGWIIFAIGVSSIFFAWAYTGGPFPLAYRALGDVTVILFYGIAAVSGTFYLHHSKFSLEALIIGLAAGFLASNILGVNNTRDIPTDKAVGKITLSLLLGENGAPWLYTGQLILAFIVPIYLYKNGYSIWVLLPYLSFPLALKCISEIHTKKGKELNPTLAKTAVLLMLYGLLQSIGLIFT
ncbi:MAG: 1,4-dihydroxy-2-naphthoate polyprenyltransferase [Chloroherpetonaceae bacterium]|nr:1,4-dihydroxy-2-naphthoate polyprenyltransferase [Chloroherpetonaceae bacterium]